ncbi:hypothetical protein P152DRAFT_451499 [Eremomyces bilateralis CBS 781.70]|uniref:EF-hand domain-containing protein n=1 Tax=Eremomyces bilateralis CBS 781.70 TaxID=1392243 RepID=A0A6G1FWS6_9PEZI|nr:uncharacterized protein P152DRAFT_451499 [Eremomyces bilateralis CBS 781.70]KAF1810136.1 hypothetical protein P152DRAFT_451499 [Eremomyces bilateralis CBS 781.70]
MTDLAMDMRNSTILPPETPKVAKRSRIPVASYQEMSDFDSPGARMTPSAIPVNPTSSTLSSIEPVSPLSPLSSPISSADSPPSEDSSLHLDLDIIECALSPFSSSSEDLTSSSQALFKELGSEIADIMDLYGGKRKKYESGATLRAPSSGVSSRRQSQATITQTEGPRVEKAKRRNSLPPSKHLPEPGWLTNEGDDNYESSDWETLPGDGEPAHPFTSEADNFTYGDDSHLSETTGIQWEPSQKRRKHHKRCKSCSSGLSEGSTAAGNDVGEQDNISASPTGVDAILGKPLTWTQFMDLLNEPGMEAVNNVYGVNQSLTAIRESLEKFDPSGRRLLSYPEFASILRRSILIPSSNRASAPVNALPTRTSIHDASRANHASRSSSAPQARVSDYGVTAVQQTQSFAVDSFSQRQGQDIHTNARKEAPGALYLPPLDFLKPVKYSPGKVKDHRDSVGVETVPAPDDHQDQIKLNGKQALLSPLLADQPAEPMFDRQSVHGHDEQLEDDSHAEQSVTGRESSLQTINEDEDPFNDTQQSDILPPIPPRNPKRLSSFRNLSGSCPSSFPRAPTPDTPSKVPHNASSRTISNAGPSAGCGKLEGTEKKPTGTVAHRSVQSLRERWTPRRSVSDSVVPVRSSARSSAPVSTQQYRQTSSTTGSYIAGVATGSAQDAVTPRTSSANPAHNQQTMGLSSSHGQPGSGYDQHGNQQTVAAEPTEDSDDEPQTAPSPPPSKFTPVQLPISTKASQLLVGNWWVQQAQDRVMAERERKRQEEQEARRAAKRESMQRLTSAVKRTTQGVKRRLSFANGFGSPRNSLDTPRKSEESTDASPKQPEGATSPVNAVDGSYHPPRRVDGQENLREPKTQPQGPASATPSTLLFGNTSTAVGGAAATSPLPSSRIPRPAFYVSPQFDSTLFTSQPRNSFRRHIGPEAMRRAQVGRGIEHHENLATATAVPAEMAAAPVEEVPAPEPQPERVWRASLVERGWMAVEGTIVDERKVPRKNEESDDAESFDARRH